MPILLKYSNGWGHLIMSVVTMAAALYLLNIHQELLATTLIGLVSSAWFVPGAARQVAAELTSSSSPTTSTPAPVPVDQQVTMPQIQAVKWSSPPPTGGNNGR